MFTCPLPWKRNLNENSRNHSGNYQLVESIGGKRSASGSNILKQGGSNGNICICRHEPTAKWGSSGCVCSLDE
jgi:hypothetical protein